MRRQSHSAIERSRVEQQGTELIRQLPGNGGLTGRAGAVDRDDLPMIEIRHWVSLNLGRDPGVVLIGVGVRPVSPGPARIADRVWRVAPERREVVLAWRRQPRRYAGSHRWA